MKTRPTTSRRSFMKCASASLAVPYFVPSSVLAGPGRFGANDRIEIAVIGIGARGKYLIANLPAQARVTALCDCSLDQIDSARKPKGQFAELLGDFANGPASDCATFQDYRELFSTHACDAAIIATSDHHHAAASIEAMRAGCDVYVEKPLAVTIAEGRGIVNAAKRFERIVQVGSQQRSMKVNRDACELIRGGALGKVTMVEERNFPGPMRYVASDFSKEAKPETMDWELFCGPTPKRDYHPNLWMKDAYEVGDLVWRGWDLFEDYSGHLMTNWGAHSIDMIQYALGMDLSGPVRITPHRNAVDDTTDHQWRKKTPPLGTMRDREEDRKRFSPLTMEYSDGTIVHFKSGVSATVFHGERGKLILSRNDYRTEPEGLLPKPDPSEQLKWSGSGHVARPHLVDWLDALRNRGDVRAPVEIGHRSATVCHLANIARRLDRKLTWDASKERLMDDDQANSLLSRSRRRGFELEI